MTATMDLISEQVLTSAASSVTFSSIPQGFKDLVLEVTGSTLGQNVVTLQLNGDTGTNYSYTLLSGNGSSASSSRNANVGDAAIIYTNSGSGAQFQSVTHIFSYSNANVFKTKLHRSSWVNGTVEATVTLWRNTSAVTSVRVFNVSFGGVGSFAAGTVLRLFGIVG